MGNLKILRNILGCGGTVSEDSKEDDELQTTANELRGKGECTTAACANGTIKPQDELTTNSWHISCCASSYQHDTKLKEDPTLIGYALNKDIWLHNSLIKE